MTAVVRSVIVWGSDRAPMGEVRHHYMMGWQFFCAACAGRGQAPDALAAMDALAAHLRADHPDTNP